MTITVDIRPNSRARPPLIIAISKPKCRKFARRRGACSRGDVAPRLIRGEESRTENATNLIELFEPIRGLLTDEEVDTLFRRNPSTGRPVDLA